MSHTFLLEIGLEEMPAPDILRAEEQLVNKMKTFLEEKHLTFGTVSGFSTPRRFAVLVEDLADKQPDETKVVRGPAQEIAQDEDGNWTKAAIGFSKGQGGSVEDLIIKEEKGKPYVYIEKHTPGQKAEDLLKEIPAIIKNIEFSKHMKWGNHSYQYIRPLHWVVALLDEKVVPFTIFDVETSNFTEGHRFLGKRIQLKDPFAYEDKLEEEYVIANRTKRKNMIIEQIEEICQENNWEAPTNYTNLLNEVVDLVEYPTSFYGEFEESYLELPAIILETSMIDHQRYFPVRAKNEEHSLEPYFIAVRNGNKDHLEMVVRGNERVLSARLADAQFFYHEDQKASIYDFTEKLKNVIYYENLGSIFDKQIRATKMTEAISKLYGLTTKEEVDLKRATSIYKFDLVTQVVDEFPALQGTVGGIYARERNEEEEVAAAISEQYLPLSATDKLPQTSTGKYLALIDKLDTLIQFFSIDKIPTGSNDPHALRRQAIGVVRLILALDNHQLELTELLTELIAASQIPTERLETLEQNKELLVQFILDRLEQTLEVEYHISHDIRQAALNTTHQNIIRMLETAVVLENKKDTVNFKEVVESMTRVFNITKTQGESGVVNKDLIETPSEEALITAVEKLETSFAETRDAKERYEKLEKISPKITDFFDYNMIMIDNEELKANRLTLLHNLANIAKRYANFSQLVI